MTSTFLNDYLKLIICILFSLILPIVMIVIEKLLLYIFIKKKNLFNEYKQFKVVNRSLISEIRFVRIKFPKYKKINYLINVLIVILVVSIISSVNLFSQKKYYDIYGNEFKNQKSVLFYDRNGNRYINEPHAFVINYDTGEEKRYNAVDSEGFLIDTTKIEAYGDASHLGVSYNKSKTEFYYNTIFIYWNENGEMIYDDGITRIEDITPRTNPYDFVR